MKHPRVIGTTPTGGMRLSGRLVKFDFLNPPLPPFGCHALIRSGAAAVGAGTQAEVPDSRGVPYRTLPGSAHPEGGCFRFVRDPYSKNSASSTRTAKSVPSLWRKRTTLDFSSAAGNLDLKSRGHDRSIIRCSDQPT